MGYALAEAALRRGASVVLVSGPVSLDPPQGVDFLPVRSTEQMRRAVLDHLPAATVVLKAAAVADYRPAAVHIEKIKRGSAPVALELEPTPDILAEISRAKGDRIIVGFAAETNAVAEHARDKLLRKGADLVVANDITAEGAGFDVDTNIVTLFSRDGRETPLPKMSKFDVANRVLDEVLRLRRAPR
jgi:phosphopantothenoylcysteine decarboxylase/phosphopantothenate--cysteine ligase